MGDLHWGDNLRILREKIPSNSVDLCYLDPPFNSNRDYNVLFRENGKVESEAQMRAFTDTWHWGEEAEGTYSELAGANHVPQEVSNLIVAMRQFIGENDVMAYLVMMTVRLIELHRVLKPTGSIYLHCDPTASHYLKLVMDSIFGPKNFRSEIIWKRYGAHNDAKTYEAVHDTILFYTKSQSFTFNKQFEPYGEEYIKERFRFQDPDGRRWSEQNLASPNPRPNLTYPFTASNGITYQPPPNGWKYTKDRMTLLGAEGRLHFPKRADGRLRLKNYLDEMPGVAVQDVWTDISVIGGTSPERLGYPTQKPEALLERIIRSSSNPGDVVLDPFCGCGTAISVSERLDRRWIGIDITHLAIAAIVNRMTAAFPDVKIERHGEPADLAGAEALAEMDRYEFQNWALAFVNGRPVAEDSKGKAKKGADRGIDGIISFLGENLKTPHRCIVQVKSGHVTSATIRDLIGTVEREKVELGLLVTLEVPTKPMITEALSAGKYFSQYMNRDYPRIQIVTIRELLDGKDPQMPPLFSPFKIADMRKRDIQQIGLFEQEA